MEFISKEIIENAMTYPVYVQEVKKLLTQGKTSTQGDNNTSEFNTLHGAKYSAYAQA